jgi:fimbrial chaperone protein
VPPTIRTLSLAALLVTALPARGELEINPVLVSLSRDERSAVVALRNQGDVPGRFEVKVYAWEQSPAGEMKLSPTEELVAFPGLVTLAPGEARNLRVGAGTAFGEVEKAYRLFIEELPPPARADAPPAVRVLARIGLPVFLAPAKPHAQVDVAKPAVDLGRVRLAVRNRGNVHVRPEGAKVVGLDASANPVWERKLDLWYVLAGGERLYDVELPPDLCRSVHSVAIEVKLARAVLREETATPLGACGR